jgi:hypothetical protein
VNKYLNIQSSNKCVFCFFQESGIFGQPGPVSSHHYQQRHKTKKSLAEKIGRSLVDKLSPGTPSRTSGCRAHGTSSQIVPTYIYPVQYGSPGYGTPASGNGLVYPPWELYNGQIIEYHDFGSGPSTPCACQDFGPLPGTLRGRPKCKKCRKPRGGNNQHWSPPVRSHPTSSSPYAKKLQQQEGVAPVPKKNLVYRDPYEFHGTFSRKLATASKPTVDDEWQAYWEQEEDDEADFVEAKASVPLAPSGLASKIRPRSKSPEPFRHLRIRKPHDLQVVVRAIAAHQVNV